MKHRTRRARAFTLLEIMLATVIGAMVIMSSIALFNAMDSMDTALVKRADATDELARLHLVMTRTFTTLVMTDQPVPRNPDAAEAQAAGAAPATASGSRASEGSSATTSTTDRASSASRSSTTTGAQSGSTASGAAPSGASITGNPEPASGASPADDRTPLPRFLLVAAPGGQAGAQPGQRLEVVLTKPPISDPRAPLQPAAVLTTTVEGPPVPAPKTTPEAQPSATGAEVEKPAEQTASQRAETRTVETTGEAAGVRGFFELIPETLLPDYTPPRSPRFSADMKQPLALVWRQLPIPVGSAPGQARAAAAPPEPIVVARGLETVRWRAFDDRERKDLFSATWQNELPAYIEMEVLTTSGQYANWMFEVDWTSGPEPGEPPAAVATRGAGGRGGGPGAGPGNGPGRGPGVGNGQGRQLRVPAGDARRGPGQVIDDRGAGRAPGERRRRDGQRRDFNPGDFPRDFNPRDLPPPPPPRTQPDRPRRNRGGRP